jgi:transcriptional regulator with XRE-family HTH domain
MYKLHLKKIRKEKRYSIKHLSEISGVSRSYISEIENEKYHPSIDKVVSLCIALKTEINDMVIIKWDTI